MYEIQINCKLHEIQIKKKASIGAVTDEDDGEEGGVVGEVGDELVVPGLEAVRVGTGAGDEPDGVGGGRELDGERRERVAEPGRGGRRVVVRRVALAVRRHQAEDAGVDARDGDAALRAVVQHVDDRRRHPRRGAREAHLRAAVRHQDEVVAVASHSGGGGWVLFRGALDLAHVGGGGRGSHGLEAWGFGGFVFRRGELAGQSQTNRLGFMGGVVRAPSVRSGPDSDPVRAGFGCGGPGRRFDPVPVPVPSVWTGGCVYHTVTVTIIFFLEQL